MITTMVKGDDADPSGRCDKEKASTQEDNDMAITPPERGGERHERLQGGASQHAVGGFNQRLHRERGRADGAKLDQVAKLDQIARAAHSRRCAGRAS